MYLIEVLLPKEKVNKKRLMINLCDYLTGNDEFQVKKYGWICYHIYLSTFSTTQERLHHWFWASFPAGIPSHAASPRGIWDKINDNMQMP